jgi:Bacteriophage CI repressor helix-turn-helix domain.
MKKNLCNKAIACSRISSLEEYDAILHRIKQVSGCNTLQEIAAYIGISPGAVHLNKKRRSVPANWLLALMVRCNANPRWIMSDEGAPYLVESIEPPVTQGDPLTVKKLYNYLVSVCPGARVTIETPESKNDENAF